MLELRHLEKSDNLRPVRLHDQDFGRAAVRFANMMHDGSALISAPSARQRRLDIEYPSHDVRTARFSIDRAHRDFAKRDLNAVEYDDVILRCTAMIALGPHQ